MIVDGVTACDGGWTHRLTLFGLIVSVLFFTLGPALLFTVHVQQAQSVVRPAAYYVPMFRGVLTAGKVGSVSIMSVDYLQRHIFCQGGNGEFDEMCHLAA